MNEPGRICNSCNYQRQADTHAPEWQCPKCQRAYGKKPAHSAATSDYSRPKIVLKKNDDIPAKRRHPISRIISLAIVVIYILCGLLSNWSFLDDPKKIPATTLLMVTMMVIIWFTDDLSNDSSFHGFFASRAISFSSNEQSEMTVIKWIIKLGAWISLICMSYGFLFSGT